MNDPNGIRASLLQAAHLVLSWEGLSTLENEDDLRAAFSGAYVQVTPSLGRLLSRVEVKPPRGFDKRLDFQLSHAWPPDQDPQAVGEFKFLRKGQRSDLVFLGRRLSDLHLVHYLSSQLNCYAFFFDVVQDIGLVSDRGMGAIRKMTEAAANHLSKNGSEESMSELPGVKAFATNCKDMTVRKGKRKTKYGFLFPPIDLASGQKRGPALIRTKIKNPDGLISIGVRMKGVEQVVPYRLVPGVSPEIAFAFALFDSKGKLVHSTVDLLSGH